MRKFIELRTGCISKAFDDEMTFTLLSRDKCAPLAIRTWVEARIATGKNLRTDAQMVEALNCAETMELEQAEWSAKARSGHDS